MGKPQANAQATTHVGMVLRALREARKQSKLELALRTGVSQAPSELHRDRSGGAQPVLSTRFTSAHGELAFFSMFTTVGAPQDITAASLRVEHFFAADEKTHAVMTAEVAPA